MEQNINWGGKRAGSGRKKKLDDTEKETITISVNKETKNKLDYILKYYELIGEKQTKSIYLEKFINSFFEYTKNELIVSLQNNFNNLLKEKIEQRLEMVFSTEFIEMAYKWNDFSDLTIDSYDFGLNSYPLSDSYFEDLFSKSNKVPDEIEYITEISKQLKNKYLEKFILFDLFSSGGSFPDEYYDIPMKEKKEIKRVIRTIDNKVFEMLELCCKSDFNYSKWKSDFYKLVEELKVSHIYDIDF